jgi:hypothetical protein
MLVDGKEIKFYSQLNKDLSKIEVMILDHTNDKVLVAVQLDEENVKELNKQIKALLNG